MRLIFDLECGPLPREVIEPLFEPFEPNSGWKDPVKIERARLEYIEDCIDRAALNPLTGQILCIGLQEDDEPPWVLIEDTEAELIEEFWKITGLRQVTHQLVGFDSNRFDLPYLVRRSWILGIGVPKWLRKGRYWTDQAIDLREIWQMGDKSAKGSLNSICTALGLGSKTEESGKDFHRWWKDDRPKAVAYSLQEIHLTSALARRLGV